MRVRRFVRVLCFGVLSLLVLGPRPGEPAHGDATVDDLLNLEVRPFAIAHRGFGENLGEDPSRPIEDTVPAVRAGFKAGVSVVEVDVQLTKDGHVAVFHDDFLADFTCINQLTLAELQNRLPEVPTLTAVLTEARSFNHLDVLSGLVIVELKSAAPLCDPLDTQEQAIVSAVAQVIRRARMTDQVMLASFSPALLYLAASEAPEITRILSISGLQFLTAEQITAILGLPVTLIDKNPGFGLQWAEIGPIYRLPGYRDIGEVLSTAAVTGARVVEADLFFLSTAGAPFVDLLHGFGLKVLGFTAIDMVDWIFLRSLGVDGIYTNDVPLGVKNQAPLPWQHPPRPSLVSAVLPASRSVMVGSPATAFATIINTGGVPALGCRVAPLRSPPASFAFQTTDPASNQLTGSPNTPVDIPPGGFQPFLVTFTPTAAFDPTEVRLKFSCANSGPAPVQSGLNTLLLSGSTTPVPDLVAFAATAAGDGIVNIPGPVGTAVFAVAATNVGAGGHITASADTGSASLPVTLSICQTNPSTSTCLTVPSPSVTAQIDSGERPTFGVFVKSSGSVAFDPAANRIFVRFRDAGNTIRGATSVAVRTQ